MMPSQEEIDNPFALLLHGQIVRRPQRVEYLDEALEEEEHMFSIRKGTGRVFPEMFVRPAVDATPDVLFPPGTSYRASPPVLRYIRRDDPQQMLIYADGACLYNGQANARAGWAFVLKPTTRQSCGHVSGRLENKGPFGDPSDQTSNRAELRAILAALRFRHWTGEEFKTLVIATDSEYVAKGATQWARTWLRNGWTTSNGEAVKNKDLWEMLLGEVERWDSWGLKIQFWRIPRKLNAEADQAAKHAAQEVHNEDKYCEIIGALV